MASGRCVPCEVGTLPLTETEIGTLLAELDSLWKIQEGKLVRTFSFRDFKGAMEFVNKVAEIAAKEWHHPDIYIFFNKVEIKLYTHSIKGLSENDFILAAKIDLLPLC